MVAGIVTAISVADAQMAAVEQKLAVFKQASLGKAGEQPAPVLTLLANQEATLTPGLVKNAANGDPTADGMMKQRAQVLQEAIGKRDALARELGELIDSTMKTMDPNNKQDMQRLDMIFDEIQAINKTTNDNILAYDEKLALLKEQAAAAVQAH
jgi:hypothetical protein